MKKNLNKSVGLVLADNPHNKQIEHDKCITIYDLFASKYMNDLVKVLENIVNSRAHACIFCAFLYVFHCCKAFLSKESQTVPNLRSILEYPDQRAREMNVWRWGRCFEIKTSVLYYTCASGSLEQKVAENQVSHITVVQLAISFWYSKYLWICFLVK